MMTEHLNEPTHDSVVLIAWAVSEGSVQTTQCQ